MSDKDKNKVSIKILLTEDHIMNMISGVITPYISTKITKTMENHNIINIDQINENLLKYIYIDSQSRLSTKFPLESSLEQAREYFPDTEDQMLIQKLVINMVDQVPNGNTIIEAGICKDSDNVKYIYGIFLDNEIISFIVRNKELIENVYFSNNFSDNGMFLYNKKVCVSDIENKFNNVIPSGIVNCHISEKYGGELISSLSH